MERHIFAYYKFQPFEGISEKVHNYKIFEEKNLIIFFYIITIIKAFCHSNFLEYYLMGLYHPLDGVTTLEYNLLCFFST
jgi:hypothetical protein